MRQINRVAVLGAGVMGATIAAHLANRIDIARHHQGPNAQSGCSQGRLDTRVATATDHHVILKFLTQHG